MAARKANGQFAKGHSGNPNGRPKRKREEQYLARMGRVVTLDDWEKITRTAVARAKAGDNQARRWLSDYLLGPPVQKLEADVGVSDLVFRVIYGNDRSDSEAS